jgi:hypothetical protein
VAQLGTQSSASARPQFGVLTQPHFNLSKSPILVARWTQHLHQLQLGKQPLPEFRALSGQRRLAGLRCQPGESYQSHLGQAIGEDSKAKSD